MKNKIMVVACSLLLLIPVLGFSEATEEGSPFTTASDYAYENARFKNNQAIFNNKVNTRIRVKNLAKKEALKAKRKAARAQDKGEGQVKLLF